MYICFRKTLSKVTKPDTFYQYKIAENSNHFFLGEKFNVDISYFKGALMQIWNFPYLFVFIWKYYPENFVFLILGILELYTRKVCEMFVYKHTETIENVKN